MTPIQFRFKDKTYYANAPVLTEQQLNDIVGAARAPNTRLIFVQGNTVRMIAGGTGVNVTDPGTVAEIPKSTAKGAVPLTQRAAYVKSHVASVAQVFGERYGQPIQLDRSLSWVYFPRFGLPRRWGARETPLLIHLPPDYPNRPPNGFYLSARCHGPHVFSTSPYRDVPDLSAYGWNWFCVHCHDGWHPGPTARDAMDLWTFIRVMQSSLSVGEF